MNTFKLKIRINPQLSTDVEHQLQTNKPSTSIEVKDRIVLDAEKIIKNVIEQLKTTDDKDTKLLITGLDHLTIIINALQQIIEKYPNQGIYQNLQTILVNSKAFYLDIINDLTFNNLITVNNKIQLPTDDLLVAPLMMMDQYYPSLTSEEIVEMQTQIITNYAFKNDDPTTDKTTWENNLNQKQIKAIKSVMRMRAFNTNNRHQNITNDLEKQIYVYHRAIKNNQNGPAQRAKKQFENLVQSQFVNQN